MTEKEVRAALEGAKNELPASPQQEDPAGPPSRLRRSLRKVAVTTAVGLSLAMLSACYGAPPPRPKPVKDYAAQLRADPGLKAQFDALSKDD